MVQVTARKQLLSKRRALSARSRKIAADKLTANVCRIAGFHYASRLAFYLANDGEIDPAQCMTIAKAKGKQCFLPVLNPVYSRQLYFVHYGSSDELKLNRYNILEPRLGKYPIAPAWSLDIIFVPLVGFDKNCHRIGMGGGYYDKTLAFKKNTCRPIPRLIGLAYDFQQLPKIDVNSWDIPLDGVITDNNIYLKPSIERA